MAIDRVREYFRGFGIEDKVLEFAASSATVELAAKAVGTAPERIAKTMSFFVHDEPILIVMAGDTKVDNKKFKACFGTKAKMIPFEDVETTIGHAVGGVCPFAINDGVKTYLDESLRRFPTVFPACGSSNSAIELTIPDLELYATAFTSWVDISKLITDQVG